jgi:acyl-coenzyme A synthetase/AMP-(fatty) acid ligase
VVFVGGYPTTATGKIRRVELRRMAATVLLPGTPVPGETVVAETVLPGESG